MVSLRKQTYSTSQDHTRESGITSLSSCVNTHYFTISKILNCQLARNLFIDDPYPELCFVIIFCATARVTQHASVDGPTWTELAWSIELDLAATFSIASSTSPRGNEESNLSVVVKGYPRSAKKLHHKIATSNIRTTRKMQLCGAHHRKNHSCARRAFRSVLESVTSSQTTSHSCESNPSRRHPTAIHDGTEFSVNLGRHAILGGSLEEADDFYAVLKGVRLHGNLRSRKRRS